MNKRINIKVPGRICLFGEHQDYLKLPVITAAIDLSIRIEGGSVAGSAMRIRLPDIKSEEILCLPAENTSYDYKLERDYFRSTANLLLRSGFYLKEGCDCIVEGSIPINSGTSSSSALVVAWARFLIELNRPHNPGKDFSAEEIAQLAYQAEVEEFGEPGGMMDHYATALGGVLFQEFNSSVRVTTLNNPLHTFVLGDSIQPKNTKGILQRVKQGVLDAVNIINDKDPSFDLADSPLDSLLHYRHLLSAPQMEVLNGALLNRDITQQALLLFKDTSFDHQAFGNLLSTHQEILAKKLKISTTKIDIMLEKSINAGAYGGKINGSGGGGCMFVYAPENTENIALEIEKVGGKAYIVQVDSGLSVTGR